MRRSISTTREALRELFFQRCFFLFFTLLAFIALAPFVEPHRSGLLFRHTINAVVMLIAVAAVGRSVLSFCAVLALATPALALRWLSLQAGNPAFFNLALRFDAAVYATTIALLLRYVFGRKVLTTDRLWGAAAAYLMTGVLWSFLYTMIDRASPEAFAVRGVRAEMDLTDLLYFSFSTLTTTGFGDIAPLSRGARVAAMIEIIVGQLFLTILIARLIGVYPRPASHRRGADDSVLAGLGDST